MTGGASPQVEGDDLPEGWKWTSIGANYAFKNGLNKAKRFFGQGTPIINYMDVYGNQRLYAADVRGKVTVTNDEAEAYSVSQGDAFFTRTSETVSEIGYSAVLLEPIQRAVFSGFVLRGRPKNKEFLPEFAAYALRARDVRKQIETRATYTTRALTNGGSLSECTFPLPPEPEQKRIAQALSDIDDLIASLDALIAKKRDIKQGAMQELLTGKRRLVGFSGDWNHRPLRDGLSQSATYGIVKAGLFQDSGIYMLRGGDIRDGRIVEIPPFVTAEKSQEFSRTVLNRNDVVISLVGYPGECAVIPEWLVGGNISRAVGLLRTNSKLSSDFLACYLNSPVGRKVFLTPSAGSAQIVVNLNELNKMPMPFPNLDEQKAIAGAMAAFRKELWELENRRAKMAELRQGMMQQLLTGRIRLS